MSADLSQAALWRGDPSTAHTLAQRAWNCALPEGRERDLICAARLQGESTLALGNPEEAEERLHHTLVRARAIGCVDDELTALTALARFHIRRGNAALAREQLDAVWPSVERVPYPLLQADARNVLAEIEIAENNISAAIAAATSAYRLAWCDGPPFAYAYGLRTARTHLRKTGAPEPEMPPYDASEHEPIEEIEF